MLFSQSDNLANWIQQNGSIENARNIGGVVPAYPIFMFLGIIAVIVASIIKMKMKKIPLRELEWAIVITVPIGIIGGTIFGKAFIPGLTWYHVFFFWEPGMSLFGALALGTTAGFVWFYKRSKVTFISVWVYADCILPNILLGQAIGRWGNMYNHEILGLAINYDNLSWIIPGIRDKLFYFPTELSQLSLPRGWEDALSSSILDRIAKHDSRVWIDVKEALTWRDSITSEVVQEFSEKDAKTLVDILGNDLTYREPLFLYESIANIFLWVIITFVVDNLSRWIQPKNKYPWDINPKAFPGWFNKKYKVLPESSISRIKTQNPIKYKQVHLETPDGEKIELKMSLWSAWNKAYYLYESDQKEIDQYILRQTSRVENENKIYEKLDKLKIQIDNTLYKINNQYNNKLSRYMKNSNKYKETLNEKNKILKNEKLLYKTRKQELTNELGGWIRYFKPNPDAKSLERINNPNHYFIIRSGVLSGTYIFGYMLIRIILETHRQSRELFVQNYIVADFIVLGLILLSGIAIILIAQFVSPYKWREVGWLYEKSY